MSQTTKYTEEGEKNEISEEVEKNESVKALTELKGELQDLKKLISSLLPSVQNEDKPISPK